MSGPGKVNDGKGRTIFSDFPCTQHKIVKICQCRHENIEWHEATIVGATNMVRNGGKCEPLVNGGKD